MKSRQTLIIDHRARCKHCGDLPSYQAAISGLRRDGIWNVKGNNKALEDLFDLKYFETQHFDKNQKSQYGKSIRGSSVRGVCSLNSFSFKCFKKDYGSYRYLITCKCGLSTWMFSSASWSPNQRNRKLSSNYEKYPERYYFPTANIRW